MPVRRNPVKNDINEDQDALELNVSVSDCATGGTDSQAHISLAVHHVGARYRSAALDASDLDWAALLFH